MEKVIRKWWLTMSDKRLMNHLTITLKYPPQIAAPIVEKARAERALLRSQKIRRTVSADLWAEFLEPARAEARTLRVMKSQLKKAGQDEGPKWDAICAYADVLGSVLERLTKIERTGETTPKQLPEALKKLKAKHQPIRDGSHWSDYVKPEDRRRITQMFLSLPPPARGRAKQPLQRTLPPKLYKRQRFALVEALTHDIEQAEQEYNMATHPDEIARLSAKIDEMYRAQFLLDQRKGYEPLPNTWHGLLK